MTGKTVALSLEAGLLHACQYVWKERKMSASTARMSPVVVEFNAVFDDEDGLGMWTARSNAAGITTEAKTKDDMMRRLSVIVPDVLESRTGRVPENVHIRVNWQELRTVDRTELAIA